MLEAVVTADPKNETAWLWLGAAADDDQHKHDYFLKALEINPRNQLARGLLKPVEARLGAEVSLPAADDETKPTKRTNRNGLIALIMIVLLILVIVLIAIRMFR